MFCKVTEEDKRREVQALQSEDQGRKKPDLPTSHEEETMPIAMMNDLIRINLELTLL